MFVDKVGSSIEQPKTVKTAKRIKIHELKTSPKKMRMETLPTAEFRRGVNPELETPVVSRKTTKSCTKPTQATNTAVQEPRALELLQTSNGAYKLVKKSRSQDPKPQQEQIANSYLMGMSYQTKTPMMHPGRQRNDYESRAAST